MFKTVNIILIIVLLCGFAACKEKQTFDDSVVHVSGENIIQDSKVTEESRLLARKMIELWDNEQTDNEPLVIEAYVSWNRAKDQKWLWFTYFDENRDLLGIIIEEHRLIRDKTEVTTKEYPYFAHRKFEYIVDTSGVVVTPREDGMSKDSHLRDEQLLPDNDLMPPYVTSLLSDNVDVYITLYDRQGNKSNKLKVERKY